MMVPDVSWRMPEQVTFRSNTLRSCAEVKEREGQSTGKVGCLQLLSQGGGRGVKVCRQGKVTRGPTG